MVSSPAPHAIVSPAVDSGGSHHFICATDAAHSGSNFKRLHRPLNVDTANGPTKVYYMCDIPTALGLLRGYILPGALHSLASVALLCKQLDLTYSQGVTGRHGCSSISLKQQHCRNFAGRWRPLLLAVNMPGISSKTPAGPRGTAQGRATLHFMPHRH